MSARRTNAYSTATRATLLALAVVVVAFTITWIQMPTSRRQTVAMPASFFARGLVKTERTVRYWDEPNHVGHPVDVVALERRVKFVYGGALAVVVLVGLAFGAWPRREVQP